MIDMPSPEEVASVDELTFPADLDELTRRYAQADKAPATLRAYRADAAAFDAWCARNGQAPYPAAPATVASFLATEAERGRKASTLSRRVAAIRYAHCARGLADPTASEQVRRVLRGIRRSIGVAQEQKAPATSEIVAAMLSHCPPTAAGRRDRAVLALGFAGAFRRSELAALDVADLVKVADGLRVRIRHSKTDQEGAGQEIAILHGRYLQPVQAVQEWLAASQISDGPLFRPVARSGRVLTTRLTDRSIATLVKRYALKAGHEPTLFSGHSLRAGFVTSAAERNVQESRIMEVTRHRDPRSLRQYIRRANLFEAHAGASFV